jgi:hypothetical protein
MQHHDDVGPVEGPWSLTGEAKYHGLRFLRITDASGGSVAYVFSSSDADLTPRQRATAHLVACAPELAAALPFFARIADDRDLVERMLEALPERERTVGRLAFGLARDAYAKARPGQAVEPSMRLA